MLCSLTLQAFVLIDHALLEFQKGFHVLTGETGAGKTLLIQAIHLLTGQKVSSDLIRKGEEKAIVEATFDIENLPAVQSLLKTSGISFDPKELLIIRREVVRAGKNRIFINAQSAPLSLLAHLGPKLIELAGQNSAITLRQSDTQLALLDSYAAIDLAPYSSAYEEEKRLEKKLRELTAQNQKEALERLEWEWDEWNELSYQDGEEETLFAEYKALHAQEEQSEKLLHLQKALDHPQLIPTLAHLPKFAEDSALREHLENALVHLQEASFHVSHTLEGSENSPKRLAYLEKRLSTLSRLKKKYHVEAEEIPSYLKTLEEKIETLKTLDDSLEDLGKKLQAQKAQTKAFAESLTAERSLAAQKLGAALTHELQSLNLPSATAIITLEKKEQGPLGKDNALFLLAANPGETPAPLATRSSGGEVARFLLALKILLAQKEALPTLIFDEIDANIGGETARLVGEKLKDLGGSCQVLTITHFPQVAWCADHHLLISKKEKEGRTITTITPLTSKEKDKELLRMLGGKSLNLSP